MTSNQSSNDGDLTVISDKTIAASSQVTIVAQPREDALPIGTRLKEFEIKDIIGWGGFGIVYLAFDHSLDRQVALKEYMPCELAVRIQGETTVAVKSEHHKETFQAGLHSFINDEARLLAHFDHHPSLVKVYRFWESNGTAYMVMPFYQGVTLKDKLRAMHTPPDEKWLKNLLSQLLGALSILHKDNCFHRDIAPDNILILSDDDKPLLLDFGAARRVIGDMTQALTVMLKPGYAPIEQYGTENASIKQGPWTDIYALAAVIYFAITGKTPIPSVDRMLSDTLVPLSKSAEGQYSADFLKGIDRSLAIRPEDRPRSVDELRTLLNLNQSNDERNNNSAAKNYVIATITVLIMIASIIIYMAPFSSEPIDQKRLIEKKEPFNPVKALEEIFDNRNRDHVVTVFVEKTQARINKDQLYFKIYSSKSGYVYLLMVKSDHSDFYLIFPNTVDQENFIAASEQLELPREKWKLTSRGPLGINHFIAIVSSYPRDFSNAGLHQIKFFAEFPLEQASQLYHNYTGSLPLFAGKAICPPNLSENCPDSYGAAIFSIEEIAE